MHCHYGRPYNYSCPLGLAFNPTTHQVNTSKHLKMNLVHLNSHFINKMRKYNTPCEFQCDWPDLVKECDAEAFLKYKCPNQTYVGEIKFYKTDDCQRYFRCKNGRPRLLLCGNGTAFEQTLNRCEPAQNVTSCEYLVNNNPTEKIDINSMRYLIIFFRTTRIAVKLFILSAFFF